MKMFRMIAVGAAALTLSAVAMPAAAQHYGRGHDRHNNDDGDVVAGLLVGAVVGGIAGAVIGDGDDRYVAGGALAGAALGAAAASDDGGRGYRSYGGSNYGYSYAPSYSYSGYGGGYRSDCDYWRDGRCWRNRGHWEREHGIDSRDRNWGRRDDRRDDRRDWRSDRRDDHRDDRRDDRRWRNY